MDNRVRSALWFFAGCIAFVPCAYVPMLIDFQLQAWMFVVDIPKPNPVLLFASLFYWPALMLLTGWYWIWRFFRWIFDDEGPLPRFFKLLVVLWAPVWIIPTILFFSALGWFMCFYKAHEIHLKDKEEHEHTTRP